MNIYLTVMHMNACNPFNLQLLKNILLKNLRFLFNDLPIYTKIQLGYYSF